MQLNSILTLSPNIEIQPFEDGGYLVVDNITKKYIRISEKYYIILTLFDGRATLSELQILFCKKTGVSMSTPLFLKIIRTLDEKGLFETSPKSIERRLPLYISFGFIFIPKRVIDRWVPTFKFLFNKKVAITLLLVCISLLSIALYENLSLIKSFDFLSIFPLFIGIFLISTFLHEMGHATAAYNFKTAHGGIGFGFYLYFMPVFFADVTDVWRLSRWKRIIVNCSGVYFEIIFLGLLSLIGFILNSNVIALLCSLIALQTLYNLLPYFRTDGYWILTDFLRQPSLLHTSFKKAKNLVRLKIKHFSTRDYFMAIYGLLNLSLMVWFIGYTLIFHFQEIIFFPQQIYHFISTLSMDSFQFTILDFAKITIPFLFYFFVIRLSINLIMRLRKPNDKM